MRTQAIIGSALMAAGGMSPLMRIPITGNWNYFDIDMRLAVIFYIFVALGFAGAFLAKPFLVRFAGVAAIILALITLAGIYFQAQDSFSFLHFKKLVNLAAGMVKYKWGWYIIFAGAFVLATVRRRKVPTSQVTTGA
ncbi:MULTISPECIES: hypothetical protein [Pedobacter]|uniref:hypothetical protein n=1 Tax=Pedobacter TaxID=84567 RepID=UPI002108E781|nr:MULTISPECIES: hypothetical protein [unclassified Pedobacter]